jgi:hypothetical protein
MSSPVERLPFEIAFDDRSFHRCRDVTRSLWGFDKDDGRQAQQETERQALPGGVAQVLEDEKTASVQKQTDGHPPDSKPDLDLHASGNLEDVQETQQDCYAAHNGENAYDAEAAHGRCCLDETLRK